MTESQRLGYRASVPPDPATPRWPRVIGTVGVVLAVLIILDKLDDLALLSWTEQDWAGVLGSDLGAIVYAALPPRAWRLFESVVQIWLGVVLLVGALALRRRRIEGVAACRRWAWWTIGWVIASTGVGLILARESLGDVPSFSTYSWRATAVFGVIVAIGILLTFPVFLLMWFAQEEVRAEYETWTHTPR